MGTPRSRIMQIMPFRQNDNEQETTATMETELKQGDLAAEHNDFRGTMKMELIKLSEAVRNNSIVVQLL